MLQRIILVLALCGALLSAPGCEHTAPLLFESPALVEVDESARATERATEQRIAVLEAMPELTEAQAVELGLLRVQLVKDAQHAADMARARAEAKRQLEELHAQVGGAAGAAASGNWPAAIVGLVGAAGAAFAVLQGRKLHGQVVEVDQRHRRERDEALGGLAGVLAAQGIVAQPKARSAEAAESPVAKAARVAADLDMERRLDQALARRAVHPSAASYEHGMALGGSRSADLLYRPGLSGGVGVPSSN